MEYSAQAIEIKNEIFMTPGNKRHSNSSNNSNSNNFKLKHPFIGLESEAFEKAITIISDKIDNIENQENNEISPNKERKSMKSFNIFSEKSSAFSKKIIEKYYETEIKLITYISNSENNLNTHQKKFLAYYIRENLYEKFIEKNSNEKRLVEKEINDYFQEYIDKIKQIKDFKEYYNTQFSYSNLHVENNDNNYLASLLKAMENSLISECKFFILSKMNIDAIPNFLIRNSKRQLKQVIRRFWKIYYEIPVNKLKLESSFSYKFLSNKFLDFINDKFNLFDEKYFNEEIRIVLFKLLILSNIEFINNNPYNLDHMLNNLKKYIVIMNLNNRFNDMTGILPKYLVFKDETQFYLKETENNFKILNELLSNEFSLLSENCDRERILLIIFSFSIMLNNLMNSGMEINEKGESEYKAQFASELKCSARERQFLINLMMKFDYYINNTNFNTNFTENSTPNENTKEKNPKNSNFSCLKINFMLENTIYNNLIKSYTKILFDEQNKTKVNLECYKILEYLEEMGDSKDDCSILVDQFNKFMDREVIIEEPSDKNLNLVNNPIHKIKKIGGKLKSFYKKLSIFSNNQPKEVDRRVRVHLQNLKITPFDPINTSTHICLCINGDLFDDLSSNNFWQNFTINDKSLDYYFFDWQTNNLRGTATKTLKELLLFIKNLNTLLTMDEIKINNNKQIFQKNKKLAKIFGKILAYIIASRCVFRFHTISLIGYSLGCHVIKHCILELNKIYEYQFDVNEIIQNVIFIAGATKFNTKKVKLVDVFKIVAGRIVNCYSKYDWLLPFFYSEKCIGVNAIEVENEKDGKMLYLENYDFSYLKLDHNEYKRELDKIMNTIDIL